jgi:hypothetical protein
MRFAIAAMLASASVSAAAADFTLFELTTSVDLRVVAVDSPLASFTEGGMGLLRYDEAHDGIRLGRVVVEGRGPLLETVHAQFVASATGDGDQNAIDLTEAFLEWRPYPSSAWRCRSRIGAYYPAISLENRGIGWQSSYALSSSAINTWIGEELRAIGVESTLVHAGADSQRPFDVGVTVGAYGWNDPAGVLIYQRGWAIHDRQTALFGHLPRPFPEGTNDHIDFFQEIDGRPGYYIGAEMRWQNRHVLRALHYDNRGDPAAENSEDYAWLTRFDSLGARIEPTTWSTLVAQWMSGDTAAYPSDDGRGGVIAEFRSWFLLASVKLERHRMSVRHEEMRVDSVRGEQWFDSDQTARAWTVAYMYDRDAHWQFGAEVLRINGRVAQRSSYALSPQADERQLQLTLRYQF